MTPLPTTSALIQRARDEAGLRDLGDPPIEEGLDRYLDALASEARISDAGAAVVVTDIVRLLVNRLRMVDAFTRHPSIADEEIRRPLFITGLPRTATTKLQHLLARDPGLQVLPYWRVHNIAPLPGSEGIVPDPRVALAAEWIDALGAKAPAVMAAHPHLVDEPEEEAYTIRMSFTTMASAAFDHVPSYRAWVMEQDQVQSYELLWRQLQFLQWQAGAPEQAWLLKSPVHLPCLPAIAATFPDATVVHNYRDPVVAIASGLRLAEVFWRSRGNQVPPAEVGPYSQFWANQASAFLRDRDDLESTLTFVDAPYQATVDDSLGVVRQIYSAWGRPLTTEAEAAMIARDDGTNPQHQFGTHEYSLETYGLTDEDVRQQFRQYIERYGPEDGSTGAGS